MNIAWIQSKTTITKEYVDDYLENQENNIQEHKLAN